MNFDPGPATRALRWWWRLLLAAIAAALAVLLGAGTASAVSLPVLETRVGASTPTLARVVGVHESVSAGQRWAKAPPLAEMVVATGVAANSGTRLVDDVAETAAKACSFSGATLVLMADGSKKPIDQVQVGDEVLATDPETGEQAAEKVQQVLVHDDALTDLQLVDGTVLTTTEDHPHWSVDDRRFERADELAAGERVLGADGRTVEVSGLRLATTHEGRAYSLAVEGIHTYHVGADEILVHNSWFTSLDALNSPKLLEGLTPSQIDDLARNAGFEVRAGSASAMNPATRYYLPGTNGSQGFRVLPQGVPGQPGVKSGAYLKYFGGPLHDTRVPLGTP